MKKIIVFLICIFIFAIIVYKFPPKNEYIVHLNCPSCFLPVNEKEMKNLIFKIKNNINWVIVNENLAYTNCSTYGLIAYRKFKIDKEINPKFISEDGYIYCNNTKKFKLNGYKVVLIDASKISSQIKSIFYPHIVTLVFCKEAWRIPLIIKKYPKSPMESFLVISNEKYAVLIQEIGEDAKRYFTQMALKTIIEELNQIK